MPPEQSGANRKNLALSGSSGQAVLQLNAVTADGRGKIAPNPSEVVADQTLAAAGVDAAEMAATTRRTFLLQSMVIQIIVLGAADEFVTEPILDEVFPRIEQTLNPVITQEAEEDSGAPFDPESLIDDDYFNDAADLQSLRSNNAQSGDQLEARAGSVESAPKDQRPIDDLLTETTALCCGATTMRTDEHSSVAADFSRDQDREFTDGLIRDGRSSHSSGQREGGGENSARHWAVCRVSAGDRNQLCDEDLLPFARLAHGINRLSGLRRTDSASRGHPKATP
jgi:hypothetical protein